jgi:hypothetical protein
VTEALSFLIFLLAVIVVVYGTIRSLQYPRDDHGKRGDDYGKRGLSQGRPPRGLPSGGLTGEGSQRETLPRGSRKATASQRLLKGF